jgi:spore germination cell wall hydrolase CwlJ-like protein
MFETIAAGFLCLAMNVYHEAKNQPFEGQVAVAQVVLNRVEDKRFPNTICEVVEQGPVYESWKTRNDDTLDPIYWPVKNRCQFSWYCDGKSDKIRYKEAWKNAMMAAAIANSLKAEDITLGATHYQENWQRFFTGQ